MRLAVILMLVAGCTGSGPAGNPTRCAEGKCPVADSLVLAAEVVPASSDSAGQPLPEQEVGEVSLDAANGLFQISLDAPVRISGKVLTSDGRSQPAGATVLATRPSRIAGRPDVTYQTHSDPTTGVYELLVSPTHQGESYTLRVLPDAADAHPPEVLVVDGGANQTVDISLSDIAELLQLHGVVSDALQAPVAGLQVQAIDPVTRATVSTTTTTDATGSFAVRLAPAPRAIGTASAPPPATMVHLVASGTSTDLVVPTLEAAVDVTHGGPANSLTLNLQVPPLPAPTQLIYSVNGVGSNGKQMPVVGAHCQFSADVSVPGSGVSAVYRVSGDTDANGKTSVMLFPAADGNRSYDVAVAPPASSNFQATRTSVDVAPTGGPYSAPIVLAQRAQVTGQVLGPDAKPIKDVMVVPAAATVAAALAAPSSSQVPKLSSALTDANGEFILRVDNGSYDFGLIPPATTSLPRQWVDGQQIATDTVLDTIVLPMGALVSGTITGGDGAALAGADVRLYALAQQNAACQANDNTCLAPPRIIAEGTSLADGTVTALLPAQ